MLGLARYVRQFGNWTQNALTCNSSPVQKSNSTPLSSLFSFPIMTRSKLSTSRKWRTSLLHSHGGSPENVQSTIACGLESGDCSGGGNSGVLHVTGMPLATAHSFYCSYIVPSVMTISLPVPSSPLRPFECGFCSYDFPHWFPLKTRESPIASIHPHGFPLKTTDSPTSSTNLRWIPWVFHKQTQQFSLFSDVSVATTVPNFPPAWTPPIDTTKCFLSII